MKKEQKTRFQIVGAALLSALHNHPGADGIDLAHDTGYGMEETFEVLNGLEDLEYVSLRYSGIRSYWELLPKAYKIEEKD